MQITSRFVFSLVACALLGGCAGFSSIRIVGDTVGAAGGLVVSETLQAGSTCHAKKSYAEGYEKGRSDSIKPKERRHSCRRCPPCRRQTHLERRREWGIGRSTRCPPDGDRNVAAPWARLFVSMKLILSLAALIFAAPFMQAQVVVTNPISDILSQTMHV
jgi:hypothetical protein